MASTREIRRRIRSVRNISQVTKAMEAVSAAKMRKAQAQVTGTRPYAQQAREVLSYIARLPSTENELDPLIQVRPVKRVGVLLITADRGLAGGFNANVLRTLAGFMRDERAKGREIEAVTAPGEMVSWLEVNDETTGMVAGLCKWNRDEKLHHVHVYLLRKSS